jgi:hypothetical protein
MITPARVGTAARYAILVAILLAISLGVVRPGAVAFGHQTPALAGQSGAPEAPAMARSSDHALQGPQTPARETDAQRVTIPMQLRIAE